MIYTHRGMGGVVAGREGEGDAGFWARWEGDLI